MTIWIVPALLGGFVVGYYVGILRAKYDAIVYGEFKLMGTRYSVKQMLSWSKK